MSSGIGCGLDGGGYLIFFWKKFSEKMETFLSRYSRNISMVFIGFKESHRTLESIKLVVF